VEAVELSRRELLTAALGSGVALAACKSPRLEPSFDGELLGQNVERGHRMRDGWERPPTRTERTRVVIVGGGAAGLSAAWWLKKKGLKDFVLLELEDEPGGTARSGRNAVSAFPWGAHYVPVPLPESTLLIELLRELDALESVADDGHVVVREELLCRAPQERLFIAGQWQEGLYPRYGASTEDLRQLRAFEAEVARFVALRGGDGRRVFTLPTTRAGTHPEADALDRVSMADFLRAKGLSSPRLHWWVDYACRDDYGCSAEVASAYAGMFYFAARVERPGGKAAEFVTWPEGNGRLIQHLGSAVEGKTRPGTVAVQVAAQREGAHVLAWTAKTGETVQWLADAVIVAVPRHVAHRLVTDEHGQRPTQEGFSYSPWVVANLTLKERPEERSFPLAWDNVLYQSRSLGYVTATHQTGRDEGPTVLTYYLPLTAGEPAQLRRELLGQPWARWADAVVSDLRVAHRDIATRIQRMDIWRWGHAMVRPTVGFLRSEALRRARQPMGRVHFAHTDLSGMALFEEAQAHGVAAADAVLRELA
jgi:protoporphyrinogen oxidase